MQFHEIEWRTDLYQAEIALRDKLLRAPLGLTFTDEDLKAEANQLHFGIVDDGGSLIACAVIVPLSTNAVKLRQMAVETSHQRRGVGSALIQSIETTLLARHIDVVELHARESAIEFYQRLGYRELGPRFMEVSIPHQKMVKSIGNR